MAFKVVPVSKFDAPEPGSSGLWACCRDVRRSFSSSPPSFCFQPVSPPLRLWWFRGPPPRGLGPFPAPVPLILAVTSSRLEVLSGARCLFTITCPKLRGRLLSEVTSS